MRKPVFGVSDQLRNKPGCIATEDDFGLGKKNYCTIYVAKIKALTSSAVIALLICAFIFAYAKFRGFHEAAQIITLCKTKTKNYLRVMTINLSSCNKCIDEYRDSNKNMTIF